MVDAPPPDPARQHDPGGKVRIALPDGVTGGAAFSACGRYRRALSRDWTAPGRAPRSVLFIGQNPSVADVEVSDPTCHRELQFARDWGFTRYLKGNVLDWRATAPRDVPKDPSIACTPENLAALCAMADEAELIVMAYGRLHKRFAPLTAQIVARISATGKPVVCLGRNADGSPKHPLYLRKDTRPEPFTVE
jgi:hypothetical protein